MPKSKKPRKRYDERKHPLPYWAWIKRLETEADALARRYSCDSLRAPGGSGPSSDTGLKGGHDVS